MLNWHPTLFVKPEEPKKKTKQGSLTWHLKLFFFPPWDFSGPYRMRQAFTRAENYGKIFCTAIPVSDLSRLAADLGCLGKLRKECRWLSAGKRKPRWTLGTLSNCLSAPRAGKNLKNRSPFQRAAEVRCRNAPASYSECAISFFFSRRLGRAWSYFSKSKVVK